MPIAAELPADVTGVTCPRCDSRGPVCVNPQGKQIQTFHSERWRRWESRRRNAGKGN